MPSEASPSSACEQMLEDDYIDMDVSSSTFLCYTTLSSPPRPKDFEFHLSSTQLDPEGSINSPADELFYKGKLLPLHLPPRLEMVKKLLHNSINATDSNKRDARTSKGTSTPFESCNISNSSSCYASEGLNQDGCYQCAAESTQAPPKKTWGKKLKLGLKLKASRACIKSLFTKPPTLKSKEKPASSAKVRKIDPFRSFRGQGCAADKGRRAEENFVHRRSFSSVIIMKHSSSSSSSASSSSSSSSFSSIARSSGHYGAPVLKRSSSVNSEVESSIQGAIAHCKNSHQLISARKSLRDVGCCSLAASRIVAAAAAAASCDNNNGPSLCRGR